MKSKQTAAATGHPGKMKRKVYENELHKLQVELCQLQDWVKATGARIIVVFEGRDAAGKGGTIKALTERVSPRVFRVMALPAPSDREKSQMFMQRYMQQFPAAGEIVIFDRSWYNRAGVEYVMGFCSKHEHQRFLELCPQVEVCRRRRYQADQNLAGSWTGGAGETICGPRQRSAAAMETESDGRRILCALVRLLEGARHDAGGHGQQARTLAYRAFGRQTARPSQLHLAYPEGDSFREGAQAEGQAAQAIQQRQIR
jgi:hypothetical protein